MYGSLQSLGQLIPSGLLVIFPPPVGSTTALRWQHGGGVVVVCFVVVCVLVVVGFGGFGGSSTSRAWSEKRPHSSPPWKTWVRSRRFRSRAPTADMNRRPLATSSP